MFTFIKNSKIRHARNPDDNGAAVETCHLVFTELITLVAKHLQSMKSLCMLSKACKLFRPFMHDERILMWSIATLESVTITRVNNEVRLRCHVCHTKLAKMLRLTTTAAGTCSSAAQMLDMSMTKHASFEPGTSTIKRGSFTTNMAHLHNQGLQRKREYTKVIAVLFKDARMTKTEQDQLADSKILQTYLDTGELLIYRENDKSRVAWANEDAVRKSLQCRFRYFEPNKIQPEPTLDGRGQHSAACSLIDAGNGASVSLLQLVYNTLAKESMYNNSICNWDSLCGQYGNGSFYCDQSEALHILGIGGLSSPLKLSLLFAPMGSYRVCAARTSFLARPPIEDRRRHISTIRTPRFITGRQLLTVIFKAMLSYGQVMHPTLLPAVLWFFYGYSLALLWLFYGSALALLWLFYGSVVALLWLCCGSALAMSWLCSGSALAILWPCSGSAQDLPWLCPALLRTCPGSAPLCSGPALAVLWPFSGCALALP
jgi:hypothetical protein